MTNKATLSFLSQPPIYLFFSLPFLIDCTMSQTFFFSFYSFSLLHPFHFSFALMVVLLGVIFRELCDQPIQLFDVFLVNSLLCFHCRSNYLGVSK